MSSRSLHALCESCVQHLPTLTFPCERCASPMTASTPSTCGACLANPPHTDSVRIAYPFVDPLRQLIHRFKYQQTLYLTALFSTLIQQTVVQTSPRPQVLIPVPIHPKRLAKRGFNQSILLANTLGRALQISVNRRCCQKIRETPAQILLPLNERKQNLLHSFQLTPIPQTHIALIDDVYTSGATVQTLAKQFKQNGVERVDVWCIARTLPPQFNC